MFSFRIIGDSGGPLMIQSNETKEFELVAVIGFRNVCTSEGLFTRVEPFTDWILDILNDPPPTPRPRTTTTTTLQTTRREFFPECCTCAHQSGL